MWMVNGEKIWKVNIFQRDSNNFWAFVNICCFYEALMRHSLYKLLQNKLRVLKWTEKKKKNKETKE